MIWVNIQRVTNKSQVVAAFTRTSALYQLLGRFSASAAILLMWLVLMFVIGVI